MPGGCVLKIKLISLKISFELALEFDPSFLIILDFGDTVLLSKGDLLLFPSLDDISSPDEVDYTPEGDDHIVETGHIAGAVFGDVTVLDPKQDLDDEGWEDEGPGFQGQKFDEGEVEGYLLAAVGSDAAGLEGFELSAFELELLFNAHLGEVGDGVFTLILGVESTDGGGVHHLVLPLGFFLQFLDD